jgi:hypothetical protein
MTHAYTVSVKRREGKRRLRRRWEGNIKLDIREIRCQRVNWMRVSQDGDKRQAVMNLLLPERPQISFFHEISRASNEAPVDMRHVCTIKPVVAMYQFVSVLCRPVT